MLAKSWLYTPLHHTTTDAEWAWGRYVRPEKISQQRFHTLARGTLQDYRVSQRPHIFLAEEVVNYCTANIGASVGCLLVRGHSR